MVGKNLISLICKQNCEANDYFAQADLGMYSCYQGMFDYSLCSIDALICKLE